MRREIDLLREEKKAAAAREEDLKEKVRASTKTVLQLQERMASPGRAPSPPQARPSLFVNSFILFHVEVLSYTNEAQLDAKPQPSTFAVGTLHFIAPSLRACRN